MSIGVNAFRYALTAFTVAAALAGFAGSLYAHYVGVITPDLLGFDVMISILVMVVVGGKGTLMGPVVGAVLVTFIPELLRTLSEYRLSIFGVALMACIIVVPDGLVALWPPFIRRLRSREQA